MLRLPVFCGLGILGLALLVGTGVSQDAKKDKDDTKKDKAIKGSIPLGWKALNLTKEQQKKIQTIDFEAKTKIAELNKKIDELKTTARIEMTRHLTDDQKATLAKLAGLEAADKAKDGEKKDKDKAKDSDKK